MTTIEKLPSTSLLTAVCIQELTSAPSSTWEWTCMREMLLEDKSTVDLNLPINPYDGDENNGYGTNDDGIGITRTGGSGSTGGNTGDLGTSDIATLFDVSSCK